MKISMINKVDKTIILRCHSFHPLVLPHANLILLIIEILMH